MTEQEINNLIDSKIGKVKMSQLPEATQTSGLYSIGYNGNQSVKYKANLLQGDPLTVRKTYQTEVEALADKNPIDPTTSLPLKVGQFISIVDDGEKNGIYRIGSIDGSGTMSLELQGKLGDLSEYTKTGGSTKTTKDIDDTKANHGYDSSPKTLKEVEDAFENIFVPGKNLFDKNTMVDDGHQLNSTAGAYVPNTDWGCTTPIKVKASTQYAITSPYYGYKIIVSYYDSNMTFLSFNSEAFLITTPAGCEYLRFSLYRDTSKSSFISSNVQLEEGSVATAVVPYELTVSGVFKGTPLVSYTPEDAAQMKAEIDVDITELDTKIGTTQTNIELGPYLRYDVGRNIKMAEGFVKRVWVENAVPGKNYFIYNLYSSTNASYGYSIRIASFTTDIDDNITEDVYHNIQDTQDIYSEIIRVLANGAILHLWLDWSKVNVDELIESHEIRWVFSERAYQVPIDYIRSQLDPILDEAKATKKTVDEYKTVFDIKQDESANLLNPLTVTPNVVLTVGGGLNTGVVGLNYDTSDFIAVSPSTVYKGLTVTSAALSFRFLSFYTITKTYISVLESSTSFTTPANCAYIRVSWSNISNTVNPINRGVFLSTVVNFSAFELPYIELSQTKDIDNKTDKELVSKGDVNNLINAALYQESGSLSLQISNTPNANVVINDGDVSATMRVRQSGAYKASLGFASVNVFGLVYENEDDVAPVHIQNSTVAANHGWRGDVLTCVGHGLTESNVGDELTANDGVKFTVMRIDSVDTFTVFRENEGSSIYFHSNTGWDGQTALTDGITTYIITDSSAIQYYPSVNLKYVKIFKDRKEVVENGSFYVDIAELSEEYDILNKESLRLNAATPENALSSINVKNTYQFRKDGISYVFCRCKIGHELTFSNIMAAQAIMISTAGYLYAPKIMTFADNVDLRRLTLFSALNGVNRYFTDDLWETGKIPNRVTNYTADKTKALMLGILTDRGVGKNLASFTKDTFEIRGSSGKTYPHPVSSSAVGSTLTGGEIYDIAMFRAYFEPIGNVDKVELPLESKTIVIVDIHEVGTFTVKLSDNLNGGLINITDSQNAIMHGDIVINSEIEITTSSDYAYIEFEVS